MRVPSCKGRKRYATEDVAKRVLWAMGQQRGRVNIDKLHVVGCAECKGWHIKRVDSRG